MARTTIDIDATVLQALRRLQREQGKTLGELVSEMLAAALAQPARKAPPPRFRWKAQPMRPRVDIEDKEALHALLDSG